MKYTTEKQEAHIAVEAFFEKYVDVKKFLGYCRQCGNYNLRWACPPYGFDPEEIWKSYSKLKIVGVKMIFDSEDHGKAMDNDGFASLYQDILMKEGDILYQQLKAEESEAEGRYLLYPGSCHLCGEDCDRSKGACRRPELRRYSIEALGGDVGKIASELLGNDLQWIEEGKLPSYLCQIGGMLYK